MKNGFKVSLITSILCAALMANTVYAGDLAVQVTASSGAPVENAVVYLEPTDKIAASSPKPAAIEQRNKKFLPLVTVAQTGASITFPNKDSVRHHVYSFSPAKTFELKLYSGVPSSPIIFDKAGTIVLGCNIHDQMLAYVYIVDTPYFSKTDATGKAQISGLPNGQYTLKVWHFGLVKENVPAEQAISIKGTEQAAIKIDIQPPLIKKP